jgi:hypothetical protein
MTAALNIQSVNITQLDLITAPPLTGFKGYGTLTAAQGLAQVTKRVVDLIPVTVAMTSAAGNYWRMCRIPANAKVQKVMVWTDAAIDSNSVQTLALSFSVGFSDAPNFTDGTPSAYSGLVPLNTYVGTVNTIGTSTRNKLFGTITQSGNDAAIAKTDLTSNCYAATGFSTLAGPVAGSATEYTLNTTPLMELFNFTTGQGYAIENGGWMDFVVYVETAAATGATGNMLMYIDYQD